uniref:G-protein coupled receptors family 1 profile domain-containing protein n=1 Tax=Photinus pyralis TaxID=7054 RepID=A0A1Y1NGS6_PHOPY
MKLLFSKMACMLMDVFVGTNILTAWAAVYLALPILASSAINPWVYGYRNSELRAAVRKVIDDLLTALGFTYRSQHQNSDPLQPSGVVTAGDPASFIHHVQGDCFTAKPCGEFLLVPIARPESSGVVSDADTPKTLKEPPRIVISRDPPLRLSKSMIDSFAISKGQDVVVIKNGECGMKHGASVV